MSDNVSADLPRASEITASQLSDIMSHAEAVRDLAEQVNERYFGAEPQESQTAPAPPVNGLVEGIKETASRVHSQLGRIEAILARL